jgi:hypothetical protein
MGMKMGGWGWEVRDGMGMKIGGWGGDGIEFGGFS